ncbi:LysE family translocator [Gemmobacter lanyuensis]
MPDLFTLIPLPQLLAFLAAGVVLNLTPGADVIFATASGMAGGPRAGAVAGIGVGLGGLWHVALAAAGVSALLAAYPPRCWRSNWAARPICFILRSRAGARVTACPADRERVRCCARSGAGF